MQAPCWPRGRAWLGSTGALRSAPTSRIATHRCDARRSASRGPH